MTSPDHKPRRQHDVVSDSRANPRVVIGWSEYVEFPDWDIGRVRAKIDTGARTSALHVEKIEELSGSVVRFEVVIRKHRGKDRRAVVTAPVRRKTQVRSSTGLCEVRYIVATRVRIGPVEKTIELSLASRDLMRFRMLLGRRALADDFLIDVSRRHLNTSFKTKGTPSPKP